MYNAVIGNRCEGFEYEVTDSREREHNWKKGFDERIKKKLAPNCQKLGKRE